MESSLVLAGGGKCEIVRAACQTICLSVVFPAQRMVYPGVTIFCKASAHLKENERGTSTPGTPSFWSVMSRRHFPTSKRVISQRLFLRRLDFCAGDRIHRTSDDLADGADSLFALERVFVVSREV